MIKKCSKRQTKLNSYMDGLEASISFLSINYSNAKNKSKDNVTPGRGTLLNDKFNINLKSSKAHKASPSCGTKLENYGLLLTSDLKTIFPMKLPTSSPHLASSFRYFYISKNDERAQIVMSCLKLRKPYRHTSVT